MPIYEFVCHRCDLCFEKLVSTFPCEPLECPTCKSPKEVERVLSVVTVGRSRSPEPKTPPACSGCPGRGSGQTCPME